MKRLPPHQRPAHPILRTTHSRRPVQDTDGLHQLCHVPRQRNSFRPCCTKGRRCSPFSRILACIPQPPLSFVLRTMQAPSSWLLRPSEIAATCRLALALVMMSQGIAFISGGDDLLRSKSLDRDSYNSGDWFNAYVTCYSTHPLHEDSDAPVGTHS